MHAMATLFDFVESADKEKLLTHLEEGECDLNARNKHGRTPLDLAALLGREEVVRVLLEKGAEVNLANSSGYSALHHGAAWGRVGCLQVLVSSGADHHLSTRHKETPHDLAERYGKTSCVEYLDCVEARFQLSQAVKSARDTLTDSERISGKWNKDDKSKVTALCNEKSDWLEHNADSPLSKILEHRRDFEERIQPHMAKLMPPTE